MKTCAYCGESAEQGRPPDGNHLRHWCAGLGKCEDGRALGESRMNRDESGLNGPETWVDPLQAPAEIRAKWAQHAGMEVMRDTVADPAPPAFKVGDRVVHVDKGIRGKVVETGVCGGKVCGVKFEGEYNPHSVPVYALLADCSPAPAEDEPVTKPAWVDTLEGEFAIAEYIQKTHGSPAVIWFDSETNLGSDQPQPTTTHTAVFEFEDGHRVEIPEPGEGWREVETDDFGEWPHIYATGWSSSGVAIQPADEPEPAMYDVEHELGRCWIHDLGRIITGPERPARIVSVTRWEREPEQSQKPSKCLMCTPKNGSLWCDNCEHALTYDHCPSLADPAPEWPDDGRPRRCING